MNILPGQPDVGGGGFAFGSGTQMIAGRPRNLAPLLCRVVLIGEATLVDREPDPTRSQRGIGSRFRRRLYYAGDETGSVGRRDSLKILETAGKDRLATAQTTIAQDGPGKDLLYRAINGFDRKDRRERYGACAAFDPGREYRPPAPDQRSEGNGRRHHVEMGRSAKAGKVAKNLRLSGEYVRLARTVLAHSKPLGDSVLAGVKPLDVAYQAGSRKFAMRIRSRAIKRAGELLKEFDDRGRPAKNSDDAVTNISQREAAEAAGMSERQKVTAIRIANVPTDEFERQVESDAPPTITPTGGVRQRTAPTGRSLSERPPTAADGCYSPVWGFLAIRSPVCGFLAPSPCDFPEPVGPLSFEPGASAPFCGPPNQSPLTLPITLPVPSRPSRSSFGLPEAALGTTTCCPFC